MVGMLIDKENIRFAFSVFSLPHSDAAIPLPLVLISKKIRWRHESSLIHSACIAISLFTHFRLKHLLLNDINGQECFGEKSWEQIKKMAKSYNGSQRSQFKVRRPPDFVPHDIYKELDDKKRLIAKKDNKELDEKDKEISDLKVALAKSQLSTTEEEQESDDESSNED